MYLAVLFVLAVPLYYSLHQFLKSERKSVHKLGSLLKENRRSWLQRFCINVLKKGGVPKHVAFILDGNRRYARNSALPVLEGHKEGARKLGDVLQWLNIFDVKEVTLYVFSIENFKRPKEEVEGLMALFQNEYKKMSESCSEEKDAANLDELGLCVKVIGDWNLVPEDLKPIMTKLMDRTKKYTKRTLNFAFAYTARNEIVAGVKNVEKRLLDGELATGEVNEKLLEESLFTRPVDLLIRTSGESRLSDFMLWQISETFMFFTKVLWPDFSIWHLMAGVFNYQINIRASSKLQKKPDQFCVQSISGGT